MRRIAYIFRKLADLFDPTVSPKSEAHSITVNLDADISKFESAMETASRIVDGFAEKQDRFEERWARVDEAIKAGARRVPRKKNG